LLAETDIIPDSQGEVDQETGEIFYREKIEKPNTPTFSKACELISRDISAYFKENVDVYEHIPAYSSGTIISDFKNIKNLKENTVDVALGVRSTVYLENEDYQNFIVDMSRKLSKDGIYIDDNVRENFGRRYRVKELKEIEKNCSTEIFVLMGPGVANEDESCGDVFPMALVMTNSSEKLQHIQENLRIGWKIVPLSEVLEQKLLKVA
jgi:hypothetical protein